MKKQQYVAAVACLVAGAIGFVSVYATDQIQKKRELARQEQEIQQEKDTQLSPVSKELEPKEQSQKQETKVTVPPKEPNIKEEITPAKEPVEEKPTEQSVPTAVAESLHFDTQKELSWPLEGEVLMDYNMDSTVYFATLDQYKCNPALIISGAVNDKVSAVARGKIIEVFESEETGCTIKQDLGDGYVAVYGQLKEPNFGVGDTIEAGQTVGYVSEPTKYYAVEGANVYFAMEKDGKPVDPCDYLSLQTMDTLE